MQQHAGAHEECVELYYIRLPYLANPSAVSPGSEIILVGPLNFHDLARIISASCTLIAVLMSLYLIWMHALHYTKPREQR